jgi:transcriptional regulator with XRE-family HTH domain
MFKRHPWYSKSAYEIQKILAERFKKARINHNWSQQELADKMGVSRLTISRMENGENISLSVFIEWLKVFNRLEKLDDMIYPIELIDPGVVFKLKLKEKKRASSKRKIRKK